jgi:signal transduction histidine kinase
MRASVIMKRKGRNLQRPYLTALQRYIDEGPAASVRPPRRLGRQAVALGLETLDLALIHENALLSVVDAAVKENSTCRDRLVKRAGKFFAEAILPLEATHRTAMNTNVRLRELNEALDRRTRELLASNRNLQREVVKRRVVEEALRKSGERSNSLLEQSRQMQEQLRLLSRRVLSAQEDERKRVSRELHDVIAQMLTGINLRLAMLKTEASANTRGITRKISHTQRLVEKSVDFVHRFARELRPAALDDLGLISALHAYLKSFTKETGIRAQLTASAGVEVLSNAKRTALYRVAQEALSNVASHAQASRVEVIIQRLSSDFRMSIKDDGKSFDVDQVLHAKRSKRLGLLGMRERVEMLRGKFTVESSPGHGTTIHAQVPFNHDAKEHVRS